MPTQSCFKRRVAHLSAPDGHGRWRNLDRGEGWRVAVAVLVPFVTTTVKDIGAPCQGPNSRAWPHLE